MTIKFLTKNIHKEHDKIFEMAVVDGENQQSIYLWEFELKR